MADKQGRRLPQWYADAVNMANDVYADAPEHPTLSIPYVAADGYGRGVQSFRRGRMASSQPPAPEIDDGR